MAMSGMGHTGHVQSEGNKSIEEFALIRAAQPTMTGTPGSISGNLVRLCVVATTAGDVAATVTTKYAPPDGHGASINGYLSVIDRANHVVHNLAFNAALRNFGGLVVAGQSSFNGNGDASLNAVAVSFAVSGGNISVTVTPPADYIGNLDWKVNFSSTEN